MKTNTCFRHALSLLVACMGISSASASAKATEPNDSTLAAPRKEYKFKLAHPVEDFDNYFSAIYYVNGKSVYNLRNNEVIYTSDSLKSLKVSPLGNIAVTVTTKKNGSTIKLHSLLDANTKVHEFKTNEVGRGPRAVAFSPDSRKLYVASGNKILVFETRKYKKTGEWDTPFTADEIVVSPNDYYLAITDGNEVLVYNTENGNVRKDVDFDAKVACMTFSNDNTSFGILTDDGLFSIYKTRDYVIDQTLEDLGGGVFALFNPDDKYVAIADSPSHVVFINTLDTDERHTLDTPGNTHKIMFQTDNNNRTFLTYDSSEREVTVDPKKNKKVVKETNLFTANLINNLIPYYAKLINDEVERRMNEWMKMMPGESLEDYRLRVNDETRARQRRIFEDEAATGFAGDLVKMATVSFGNYNRENDVLAINFDKMPTILLPVPEDDVTAFVDPNDLDFRDVKYGLTSNDTFEMIYANVYNKKNSKNYTYDNTDRTVDFLASDEAYVPLELIQQAKMEELRLQEIKDEVMAQAKSSNILSDHTNITVDSRIESDNDADGNAILNYIVDVTYQVDPDYSAQEDFAPGKYHIAQSGAASAMLDIVKQAFEGELAQYVTEGGKLQVNITGMADALPIHGMIAYDGAFGDLEDEPVYCNDELTPMTVTRRSGITSNPQLAFVRATAVKDYLTNNIPSINKMRTDYRTFIEVTEGTGGEYRRINVRFKFFDVFKDR